jgi:peptidoglycan hydrolase-like protein with peptidoglycan-binding domain
MKFAFTLFVLALAAMGIAPVQAAGKRVALVIGNSAYTHATPLANPKNDVEDMAAALKPLGFTVILATDLTKSAMDRKILEFALALENAEAAVFHYSGHGLQVAGVNYLVPVDAELVTAASLDFEMVRLDLVQRSMERETKTSILFLDACRNNPLSRNLARALGTRGIEVGGGLAPAESGVGTLISFSTQPGNVAQDGEGRNSPYSGPLIKAIGTPSDDILSILTRVRKEVLEKTGGKQVPWENHALLAKFYFAGTGAEPADAKPVRRPEDLAVRNDALPIVASEQIKEAKRRLYELNYDPGPEDGALNDEMKEAIRDFQGTLGLKQDGVLTEGLLQGLRLAPPLKPWGAIAYSKTEKKWGMSWATGSRNAAVAEAQAACGSARPSCTAVLTFFGSECGAFAYSDKRWSLAARTGMSDARRAALEECGKDNPGCKILAGVCSSGTEKTAGN